MWTADHAGVLRQPAISMRRMLHVCESSDGAAARAQHGGKSATRAEVEARAPLTRAHFRAGSARKATTTALPPSHAPFYYRLRYNTEH